MIGGSRRATLAVAVACHLGALCVPAGAGGAADPPQRTVGQLRAERAEQRRLAGHLLRRLGFGPNRREMHEVLRLGLEAYIERQLHPEQIDDRLGERYYRPPPGPGGVTPPIWWVGRMLYTRRQLQEKMALIWHEHFPSSYVKVASTTVLRDQEELFRARALGSFRDLLIAITKDNAMLRYLDNNGNNGRAVDEDGQPVPPNENYARELLQLFSLGVNQLRMDGTPILDRQGRPLPAYNETDVREIARALTGWVGNYPLTDPEDPNEVIPPAAFVPERHDPSEKIVLGDVIAADDSNGAADVDRVVDIIMRQPTTAPFIARELILKLATETPSPGYVKRVALVFALTHGDIRASVRAILMDPEFYGAAVVATQFKTPVEHVMGALRGIEAKGPPVDTIAFWTLLTGQLLFFPPSVFSYYRPGYKGSLLTPASVMMRDQVMDMIITPSDDRYFDGGWDAAGMIRRQRLAQHPERAIDLLARDLLAAPLSPETRRILMEYAGPIVTEEKLRGLAWLILTSPDYQAN
jgi:hypothetical protein